MKRSKMLASGAVIIAVGVLSVELTVSHARAAPCPWSETPACVIVRSITPAAGSLLAGTVALQSTARQSMPERGRITHVEWWLYNPDFKVQNPNNEEGKLLLAERINQAPTTGNRFNGTWDATWTVPENRSMTTRDGDYRTPGTRTYTLPLNGSYKIQTHVLDDEWDRTYGGPAGVSDRNSVSINFGAGGVTPPPPTVASVKLSGSSYPLAGTNIPRAADALVRYTGTAASPANEWGLEASVSAEGVILSRSARQPGMAIPPGGSVLSGYGLAADWLDAHGVVGSTVGWPGDTVTDTPSSPASSTPSPITSPTTSAAAISRSSPAGPPGFTPAAEQNVTGRWAVTASPMPVRAMHATLLRDGRVLLIAGSGSDPDAFLARQFTAAVWNPTTNTFLNLTVPVDMFCSGHVTLPDGRILVQGGTLSYAGVPNGEAYRGLRSSYIFNPSTNVFTRTNDTIEGHWYPTLTKLENGDVWAAGGYTDKVGGGPSVSTEMFNTARGSWLRANQVPQTDMYWGTYPHMFLMADGRMFYTGGHTFGNAQPGTGAMIYDWRNATVGDIPGLRNKELRDQAGSVLLPPAQNQTFMIAGGGSVDNGGNTNSVDIINMNQSNPRYVPGPTLPGPGRLYLNLTTLPDRTVLASNGGTMARGGDVFAAALYQPLRNSWTAIPADPVGRNYHSASLLLADGRVAVFGSNPADGSYEFRISMYEPPYLFKGTRPIISAAATDASYGQAFTLGFTGNVVSASLTSPGSPTHQTDTNIRLVDLPLTGAGSSRTATVPMNRALLPPGPYMLTVLTDTGVPSIARWINIR